MEKNQVLLDVDVLAVCIAVVCFLHVTLSVNLVTVIYSYWVVFGESLYLCILRNYRMGTTRFAEQ
jgi:hypothetical protein